MATAAPNRWATLAAQTAALKYQPKYAALANAIGEAENAYGTTVQEGKSTAALTAQTAKAALPAIQSAYGTANAANAQLTSKDLAALPSTGVTGAFQADQQSEVKQQLANLLTARAGAEAQNAEVAPAAAEGAQFNQLAARTTLANELGKLFTQRSSLAGEEGSDAATEEGKLLHEAESNQRQAADAQLSASTSRENAIEGNSQQERASQRTAASKAAAVAAKASKGAYLPLSAQTKAAAQVRNLEGLARSLRNDHNQTASQALKELTSEHPTFNTPKLDENGKPLKNSKGEVQYETVKGIKPADSLLAQAAVDSVYNYGSVSAQTLAKLHNAGYTIKALDLAPPKERTTTVPKVTHSIAQAVSAVTGSV